jgi:hypothetical protein
LLRLRYWLGGFCGRLDRLGDGLTRGGRLRLVQLSRRRFDLLLLLFLAERLDELRRY